MIHCYGNSHVAIFSGSPPSGNKTKSFKDWQPKVNPDYPNLRTVFLGPIIAYNFYEHHLSNVKKDLIKIPKTDSILLCVGEIDCRYHIAKKIMDTGGDIDQVVLLSVRRYVKAISQLTDEGWNMIVVGVHPSTLLPHCEDLATPHWGDCAFRNSISASWNSQLSTACDEIGVTFVSIYDFLVDDHNITLDNGAFLDFCHISYDMCFPLYLERMRAKGVVV